MNSYEDPVSLRVYNDMFLRFLPHLISPKEGMIFDLLCLALPALAWLTPLYRSLGPLASDMLYPKVF